MNQPASASQHRLSAQTQSQPRPQPVPIPNSAAELPDKKPLFLRHHNTTPAKPSNPELLEPQQQDQKPPVFFKQN
jgi:hypothetical protein